MNYSIFVTIIRKQRGKYTKKVVIIDFDEQYINTSIIVYNGIRKALFSHKGVDSPKITLSDVEEVINLNLEGIINYL